MRDVRCRPAEAEDFRFLATMLGEAASRHRPPTADQVLADPRYAMYLAGWPRQGDYGLVAEQDEPLGAAWYRTYTEADHGFGFVSADVPELSVAVIASRRREGIGRRLLVDLIEASVARGHPALSLSVNNSNPARLLYESVGFVQVERRESGSTMVRRATQVRRPTSSSGSLACGSDLPCERPHKHRAAGEPTIPDRRVAVVVPGPGSRWC